MSLQDQLRGVVADPDRVVVQTCDGETIVVAVTPLMARAHALPEAGHIVFLDASGNMDRRNLRVFLLMTWSLAGGLPLGVIVTSSESQAVISRGLEILTGLVPDGMFTFSMTCVSYSVCRSADKR